MNKKGVAEMLNVKKAIEKTESKIKKKKEFKEKSLLYITAFVLGCAIGFISTDSFIYISLTIIAIVFYLFIVLSIKIDERFVKKVKEDLRG